MNVNQTRPPSTGKPRLRRIPLVFALFMLNAAIGWAYTPEDPVVVKLVDRGLRFLEKDDGPGKYGLGGHVLKAYAHHKVLHDTDTPVVKKGIDQALLFARDFANRQESRSQPKAVYEAAVSVLLLAEVDRVAYDQELRDLQRFLFGAQYDNGAFGYYGYETGDVSQVQYAMLAIWTLDRIGIELEYGRVASCIQWLMRVQDPSGAWPYQGNDPGPGSGLIKQMSEVGMSMALAGGSAALIGGDALRVWGASTEDAYVLFPGMPKAVDIYEADTNAQRRRVADLERPIIAAIKRCEAFRSRVPFKRDHWYYYQLYTLERYESFLEIAMGETSSSYPGWYDEGVEALRRYQNAQGAWGMSDNDNNQAGVCTSFAILFLIRSTQRSIAEASSGTLAGGYELPKDTTDIRVEGTQIKGRPIATEVTKMLDILESDGAGDTEGKSIPDDLELDEKPAARKAQLDRLERLVRGSRSWQARRVAARLLGKSDELRVVPSLIFALSDPDKSVKRYARDGLRFISRRFDGFGMPDDPNAKDVLDAQRNWRDWYRTMNPKYVFLDYDL